MKKTLKTFNFLFFFAFLVASLFSTNLYAQKKIKIAMAEPPSDELAAFFLALDRAKKKWPKL